ncbi:MAG: hypothetical protein EA422_08910 [Gemmatimonadales bacterium]|nr:MAG: hypothetical protein EA422_08910 [Gemmatimonadales bacterium]
MNGSTNGRCGGAASCTGRRRVLLTFWILMGMGLLWRSVDLQLLQGADWRAEAERQHRMTGEIPAARGAILDRTGTPLVLSMEAFAVSVAPHEVRDTTAVIKRLSDALGLSPDQAGRPFQSGRRWVPLPGRHPVAVREALSGITGVYVQRDLRREAPHGPLLGGIVGAVIDGVGQGGVEQAFDELLRGDPGMEILARDSRGRPLPGESWMVQPPLPGGEVVLTVDSDLQEIVVEALQEALERTGARGGDLVVTDPHTGEILAMVSMADGSTRSLAAITSPYEPGSTLKPFTVATLLQSGKATLVDSVDTGDGRWRVAGRTLTDVQRVGNTDLGHALRASSNIALAKLAERLTPAEQFEGLRDFGFGARTGVELPGEARGSLSRPQRWSRQTPASLAIGYEVSATSLQLAMAYGALANGGVLMEPRLIRELRGPDGTVLERREPRAVRRVVSQEVARDVSMTLAGAVADGTGTRAGLATFSVAGKTGTSRVHTGSGYADGDYFATFGGYFPAEDPQLVVFVKLDRPQGEFFGGATAAPVTRATMEAVLAAHAPPLNRSALATLARHQERSRSVERPAPPSPGPEPVGVDGAPVPRFASLPLEDPAPAPASSSWVPEEPPTAAGLVRIPVLEGVSSRVAARRLHGLGLHVRWETSGPVTGVEPEAGSMVAVGDTVRLLGTTDAPPLARSARP